MIDQSKKDIRGMLLMKMYTLDDALKYETDEKIKRALKFLKESDFSAWETGRYDISSDMFVLIQRYDTVPQAEARYEAHRKYIDIQYIIRGEETIYWAPLSEVEELEAFDEAKDIGFYERAVPHAVLKLHEGEFGLFYPCDAHKPSFHEDGEEASFVEKAVVKIRV